MVTQRCNCRCQFCSCWECRDDAGDLPPEAWIEATRRLTELTRIDSVCLGGGEPLLYKGLDETLRGLAALDVSPGLISNGVMLNRGRAERLVDAGAAWVNLSLDGPEQTHDELRGVPGLFERVIEAVAALKAVRPDLRVCFSTLICGRNISQLPELVEWVFEATAVDGINFQAYTQVTSQGGADWWRDDPLWPQDQGATEAALDQLIGLKGDGAAIVNPVEQLAKYKEYFNDPDQDLEVRCLAGAMNFAVDASGDVRGCIQEQPVGNITRDDAVQIYLEGFAATRCMAASCPESCHFRLNCFFPERWQRWLEQGGDLLKEADQQALARQQEAEEQAEEPPVLPPLFLFSEFDYENELHYELRLKRDDYHVDHARAATARRFVVAVCRTNFFKLDRVLARALTRAGATEVDLPPPFPIQPLADMGARFQAYFEALPSWAPPDGFEVGFEVHDPELGELFEYAHVSTAQGSTKNALMALSAVTDAVFTGPAQLLIDPTTVCNVDCVYCRSFSPLRPHKILHTGSRRVHLGLETVRELLAQAKELDVRRIALVGGAEPTAVPYFEQLVQELGIHGFDVDMSTNGTLLSKRRMEMMVDSGAFDTITFSISAASQEGYQCSHPSSGRLWPRLLDNLRHLARYKGEQGASNPKTVFLFVIYRDTFDEIGAAVRLAAELGMDAIWFQLLHKEEWNDELSLDALQAARLTEVLADARAEADDLGLEWPGFIEPQAENLDADDASWSDFMYKDGCFVGWYFAFLSYQGGCHICCGQREVGNLAEYDHDLVRLWRSDKYRFLRQQARMLSDRVNIRCPNGRNLSGRYCHFCDNHNFNESILAMLRDTRLHRLLGSGLGRSLIRESPVDLLEVEQLGGQPLELEVRWRSTRPRVNMFIHLYFFTRTGAGHECVLSETYLPVVHQPAGEVSAVRTRVDNYRLTSDGGVFIGAEVVYREGELVRFHDEPRVAKLLEADAPLDLGGGLVPMDHTFHLLETEVSGTRLQMLTLSDEPLGELRQGEGCVVDFQAALDEPVLGPMVRYQLYRVLEGEDIFVFGTNNVRHGLMPARSQGQLHSAVEIPRLELMPGEYYFTGAVEAGSGGEVLLFRRGAPFMVSPPAEEASLQHRAPILDFRYTVLSS